MVCTHMQACSHGSASEIQEIIVSSKILRSQAKCLQARRDKKHCWAWASGRSNQPASFGKHALIKASPNDSLPCSNKALATNCHAHTNATGEVGATHAEHQSTGLSVIRAQCLLLCTRLVQGGVLDEHIAVVDESGAWCGNAQLWQTHATRATRDHSNTKVLGPQKPLPGIVDDPTLDVVALYGMSA